MQVIKNSFGFFALFAGVIFVVSCKQPSTQNPRLNQSSTQDEPASATEPLTPLEPSREPSRELSQISGQKRQPSATQTVPKTSSTSESVTQGKQLGCGQASFYGNEFSGRPTASGETFNPSNLTAAHRTLSFGTQLRVVKKGQNPSATQQGVIVRINDRGPFVSGRIIDLSSSAFQKLASTAIGVAEVCLYSLE